MAIENTTKQPSLKERIAARQQKRAEIGKEAKVRTACAYTVAKSLIPAAPVAIQQKFASILLQVPTKILKAALRQTAINAHYTKLAETLKEVHKVELNQLLEASGDLEKLKNEVKAELKGDAKAAAAKVADDREAAGPQPAKYNDGTPASGDREYKADKRMDAENAGEREADTVNKTDGGKKIEDAVQDSARAEVTGGKSGKTSASKKACSKEGCKGCAECSKESSAEKESNFGADGKPNSKEVLQTKTQTASAKTADEMTNTAPQGDESQAAPAGGPAPLPEGGESAPTPAPEGAASDLVQEDQKEVLHEKVQEAAHAVQAIEQEISKEEAEEVDLTGIGEAPIEGEGEVPGEEGEMSELDMQNIFAPEAMSDKVSALANEHHEGADDDFFGPSDASAMEASLDEAQFASLDDMFSTTASADSMASLFEVTASSVDGFAVVPSSTGEAANHFEADHGKDDRDNETDHDNDILSLLVEGLSEQKDGQERVKQDATNELEQPQAKEAAVKAKSKTALKHIKTAAPTPAAETNPVDALFASIDAFEDERNNTYGGRRR